MRGRENGFTLVEGMIALLILSTGLLALARFQGGVTQASAQTKARSEALRLAEDKVETIRGFASLAAASVTTVAGGESDTLTGSNAVFTRSWTRTNVTAVGGVPACQEVQVTVTWQDRSGGQSVVLRTLLGQVEPTEAGNVLYLLGSI